MSEFTPGWTRYFAMIEAQIARQTDEKWRANWTKTLESEKKRARTSKTARPPRASDLRGIGFDGRIYA